MRHSITRNVGLCAFVCTALALILITSSLVDADDQEDPSLRAGGGGEDAIVPGSATDEQLEKLVAPVALYPDALLAKVLDACKHPSAITAAGDFLRSSEESAKPDPNWPPSIQALLHYPNVLMNMDGNLGWATRLGAAWRFQQSAAKAAVNYVRQQAQQAGNLESNEHQTVSDDGGTFGITSTGSDVMYVPQYDPAYLYVPGAFYGGHGYAGAPRLHFARGMAVGAAIANHHYVHGDYPHYRWAPPGAAYGAGLQQGRRQGVGAGAAAGNRASDASGGGNHVHYHVHHHYGDAGGGFGMGMQQGGFGGGVNHFGGGAHFGGFHGGGRRR